MRLDKITATTVLGALATIPVHWLGHVAYMELNGLKWHQKGLTEFIDEDLTDKQKNDFAYAGFIAQLTISKLLPDGDFKEGFKQGNFIYLGSYAQLRNDTTSDIKWMTNTTLFKYLQISQAIGD